MRSHKSIISSAFKSISIAFALTTLPLGPFTVNKDPSLDARLSLEDGVLVVGTEIVVKGGDHFRGVVLELLVGYGCGCARIETASRKERWEWT